MSRFPGGLPRAHLPRTGLLAFVAIGSLAAMAACSSNDGGLTQPAPAPTTATVTPTAPPGGATSSGTENHADHEAAAETPAASPVTPSPTAVTPPTGPSAFVESFDGAPDAPEPWTPSNWDITVHSRNVETWDRLDPMEAQHGHDCAGPPSTHSISSYADAVFQCKEHMMTSINAEGYGLIYLTPDHQVDFSGGDAVIRFDISTLRSSGRDWWDVWITPYEDNVQLALDRDLPDLTGPPQRAIHVFMDFGQNVLMGEVYHDFQNDIIKLTGPEWQPYDAWLTPDAARRDTFELRISDGRITFGMPAYDRWWIDDALPREVDWTKGVVQFGHHSYTPTKDCFGDSPCTPNTWHWDNVTIDPALPFAILHPDRDRVNAEGGTATFAQPAPDGSHLRFAGIGSNLEVSFDGGGSWTDAIRQNQARDTPEEHYSSFWTPVPAGTKAVQFRGDAWWGGDWNVRAITMWADTPV